MADKQMSIADVVSQIESGMTVGIGGWGSRRKPMAIVRALCNSSVKDLTLVSYGGPDVGLLVAAGKVKRLISGFVSLDSIALEPHFRLARQKGELEFFEIDEATGEEPNMDVAALMALLVDLDYDGFISSEWEGHGFRSLDEVDSFELVRRHQALERRGIEAAVAAKGARA